MKKKLLKITVFLFVFIAGIVITVKFKEMSFYFYNAVCAGDSPKIKSVISNYPFFVNHKWGKYKYTPLHVAAASGYSDIVKLLLDNGAKVNSKSAEGKTPLDYAIRESAYTSVEVLIKHGGQSPYLIHYYANTGNLEKIIEILNVNPEFIELPWEEYGDTPLMRAVSENHKNIAEYLITKGADVNTTDYKGNTIVHRALLTCDKDMLKLVVSSGADVNKKNEYENSPLDLIEILQDEAFKDVARELITQVS